MIRSRNVAVGRRTSYTWQTLKLNPTWALTPILVAFTPDWSRFSLRVHDRQSASGENQGRCLLITCGLRKPTCSSHDFLALRAWCKAMVYEVLRVFDEDRICSSGPRGHYVGTTSRELWLLFARKGWIARRSDRLLDLFNVYGTAASLIHMSFKSFWCQACPAWYDQRGLTFYTLLSQCLLQQVSDI